MSYKFFILSECKDRAYWGNNTDVFTELALVQLQAEIRDILIKMERAAELRHLQECAIITKDKDETAR